MKHTIVLLVASMFTACYAESPYDAQGPVAYAGPSFYSAYPCEWGTCYYDGPRMVYYEHAPVRSNYGGVSVHYYETAYVAPREAARPVEHESTRLSPRESARPVQRESARPVQRESARPVQRESARPVQREAAPRLAPHEHARQAQQEAARRAQHQSAQPRKE